MSYLLQVATEKGIFAIKIILPKRQMKFLLLAIMFNIAAMMPASAESFLVKCQKLNGSHERCKLTIVNSVLQGNNGTLISVGFPDGYLAEAFCIDEQSNICLVRTKNSRWEKGRVRWVEGFSGIKKAFLIENSQGFLLGLYDAPNTH